VTGKPKGCSVKKIGAKLKRWSFKQPLVDENFARSLSRFRNVNIRFLSSLSVTLNKVFLNNKLIPDLLFIAEFLGPNYY